MRRKILQDHANVFCQMLVGWRMTEDLDRLSSLGSGHLSIDVLAGTATFDGQCTNGLYIAGELNAWFLSRLSEHGIPNTAIEQAVIETDVSVQEEPRRRGSCILLSWNCHSIIRTADASYSGQLTEDHRWIKGG